MKRLAAFFINSLIKVLEVFSRALSFNQRVKFAKILSNLVIRLSPKRWKITISNLEGAFPEKSPEWLNDIAKKSYDNLAITFLELLSQKSFSESKVNEIIKYDNIEVINEALSRGRGAILMSGHYGNWELLAFSAGALSGKPILIVVKGQKYGDKLIYRSRVKYGNTVVDKSTAARKLIQTVRQGGAIAILADQNPAEREGVIVDFFGRPTLSYKAPAELALKYNIPIIMGFAVRQADNTYRVRLEELDFSGLNNNEEGVRQLTQMHIKALEKAIREKPGLWAWQHRRWKNSPPVKSNVEEKILNT